MIIKKTLILTIILCIPAGCLYFGGRGEISGIVKDNSGNPVTGALVCTTPATVTVITNDSGYYLIERLPCRDYIVSASSGQVVGSVAVALNSPGIFSFYTELQVDIQFGVAISSAIYWYNTYDEGLAAAVASEKPMMIDFYADWCGPCRSLSDITFKDIRVVVKAVNFICTKVDIDVENDIQSNYGVTSIPTIVFITSAEVEVHRNVGYESPDSFLDVMETALGKL